MCFKRASDRNWWSFPGFSPSFSGDAIRFFLKKWYSQLDAYHHVMFSVKLLYFRDFWVCLLFKHILTIGAPAPPATSASCHLPMGRMGMQWRQLMMWPTNGIKWIGPNIVFFGEYPQETNMVFTLKYRGVLQFSHSQHQSILVHPFKGQKVLNPGCAPWSPRSKTTKMWRDAARICPFSLEFGGLNWGKKQRILI